MLILGLQKTTLLDYPQHVASTIFTGGCNFRCPYCHNGDLVVDPGKMEPFSEEEIFDHLTKRKKLIDGVCITGGEPTLQKDLISFVKKVKDLGLLVKLDTNGTRPDVIKELMDQKLVDYIAMDIKSSPANYNKIACEDGFNLDNILTSIKLIMEGDVEYEFRTTLVKELHTKDDIISIGHMIAGAKRYYLQSYKESDAVICPGFLPFSIEELNEFVDILKEFVPNTSLRGVD